MPQYVDCYSLLNTRNRTMCEDFLNAFAAQREESADEYFIEDRTFDNVFDLMKHLEINRNVSYSIYFRNIDMHSMYKHVMIFYTDDGKAILGISISKDSNFNLSVKNGYNALMRFTGSEIGCVTVEEAPPDNSLAFMSFAETRPLDSVT